jgi:sigma-70-like protein/activator of Hsp90 ATPase-like protein
VRPGGAGRAAGTSRGQPYVQEGEYVEVELPHKLVHTWDGAGKPDAPSIVTYLLERSEKGTRLTLRQTGFISHDVCNLRDRMGDEPQPARRNSGFMSGTPKAPASEITNEANLLRFAQGGDQRAFQRLTEPHRRELQLHSYRMLGSFQGAEDMVQETFLRAWRGLQGFDGRASIRQWLYRIATNACLSALATRGRAGRFLPETHSPQRLRCCTVCR